MSEGMQITIPGMSVPLRCKDLDAITSHIQIWMRMITVLRPPLLAVQLGNPLVSVEDLVLVKTHPLAQLLSALPNVPNEVSSLIVVVTP
jgi:hypothetical protein